MLPQSVACTGAECNVDGPRLFKVVGAGNNATAYFEWQRPACVEFPFYADAKVVTVKSAGDRDMCADPRLPQAGSCCKKPSNGAIGKCHYSKELMSYATNAARCSSAASTTMQAPSSAAFDQPCTVCDGDTNNLQGWCGTKSRQLRHWTSASCKVQVQVDGNGWLRIVHTPYGPSFSKEGGPRPSFAVDNENIFRVAWDDGLYPRASSGCADPHGADAACVVSGTGTGGAGTCLCDVEVRSTRVFDAHPSSAAAVLASCQIGSLCPEDYDAGEYTKLDVGGSSGDVEAYFRTSNPSGGGFNEDTILRVVATGRCFANRRSLVQIRPSSGGHSATPAFQFRNGTWFSEVEAVPRPPPLRLSPPGTEAPSSSLLKE